MDMDGWQILPEGRLAGALTITLAVGASTVWRAHVALRREAIAGRVHLLAHIRLWGLVVGFACGLALELIVVLERHGGIEQAE